MEDFSTGVELFQTPLTHRIDDIIPASLTSSALSLSTYPSAYDYAYDIGDFKTVEEKGEKDDVPRLLPSSPALEMLQPLYRMENYDSLCSSNEIE